MNDLITKLRYSIKAEGLSQTLMKCFRYPLRGRRERKLKLILDQESRSEVFTNIFQNNCWGNSESASGGGSTLYYTEALRRRLPDLFRQLNIKTVYDAPCGDFNWMRHVVSETGVRYIGADIVPALIAQLNKEYSSDTVRFLVSDITTDRFPAADLWICRDCLFHLSYADIYSALKNFAASKIPLALTTTHLVNNEFNNNDIRSGDFRRIDLFSAPFHLPKDVSFRIPDWVENSHFPARELCLWTREQVAMALPRMASAMNESPLQHTLYSGVKAAQ